MSNNRRDIQLIELKDTIAGQQAENDNLKAELVWLHKKYFGLSSEKRNYYITGQLNLFGDSA